MTPRLALLALLAVAAVGRAETPPAAVRDAAGLFSEDGRRRADEKLRDLRAIYHLDVVVQTVEAPPADDQERLKQAKSGKERNQAVAEFFKGWGAREAEKAEVDGVHVLICKEVLPKENGYVQVTVWPAGAHADLFPPADQRKLHDKLAGAMKKDDGFFRLPQKGPPPDLAEQRSKVLNEALDEMREALRVNSLPPFPWGVVIGVIAGALALWGVLGLVRMRLRKPDAAAGKERPGALAGLLGGLFGTAAGHWIYDTLFFHGPRASAAATGAEAPSAATPEAAAAPAEAPEEPAAADR
jgi:hypothetical protein